MSPMHENKPLDDPMNIDSEEMGVRGAVSPFEKMPHELLREVLLHLFNPMSPLKIPTRRSRTFPWAPSQVCTHWRETLWGIPGIWENIRIQGMLRDAQILSAVHIFRAILSYTTAQISLVVPLNEQLLTALVIPYISRLKGLEMTFSQNSFRTFFELPGESVESLESINLHLGGDLPHLTRNSFQHSPNLRKVILTNSPTASVWPHHLSLLPWSQLTDVALPNLPLSLFTLHTILNQCVCLRVGSLAIGDDTSGGLYSEYITVPKLESLVLKRYGPAPLWHTFLHPLVLPSLQSLLVPDAQTWDQAAFTSLIVRSGCPLKSIYLAYYRETTYDLHSFLKQVPSLCELILPWLHITHSIFDAVRRREILPKLERLECIVDPPGLTSILDLVESYISGQPNVDSQNVGIRLGRFVFFSDEDDFDNPFKDPLKRYYDLQSKFRDNGRDINVMISTY